ncbi:MAG: hypothetical protein M1840_008159 [Geoglossum simile]|nr:MAG: hypothetical protein M1840_008159 [Geoglossum simile]
MAGNFIPSAHLSVSNQPRLPFSSPIVEEIHSPVSPLDAPRTFPYPSKTPDSHSTHKSAAGNTDLRRTHDSSIGFNGHPTGVSSQTGLSGSLAIEASRAETRSAAPRSSRSFSVNKPSRDRPRKGARGIRIVTNFTKQHDVELVKQKPTEPPLSNVRQPGSADKTVTRKDFAQGQGKQTEGFVRLSDLKALDDKTVPTGFWKTVIGDGQKQKRRSKGSTDAVERTQKRKQSGNSPQRAMALGFKNVNLRQNTRGYEEISDDEVPILAMGGGNTVAKPTGPIPSARPGNGIVAGAASRRAGHLAPSPTKWEDALSPSDGPIVIGLSIPSGTLSEFQFSPESASPNSSSPARYNGHGRSPSEAPTILVTPAEDDSDHVPSRAEQAVKARPRARSSVYSQPSPGMRGVIPPMPAIPANMYRARESNTFERKTNTVRDSGITVFEEDEDMKTNGRGVSTYTVFEEDETPDKRESTRPTERPSIDTATAYRRSHGWWNHIVTPFLTPSSANAGDKWEGPTPWSPAKVSPTTSQQEKELLPDVGGPVRPKSGHTTIWSNMSTWANERETIGIAIDHTPRASNAKASTYYSPHQSSEVLPGSSGFAPRAPMRTRSDSEGTEFEEDNEIPTSRIAGSSVHGPRAVSDVGGSGSGGRIAGTSEPAHQPEIEAQPPPYSPPRGDKFPRYVAILPQSHRQPDSPGPLSPGVTQILASRGAIPMSDVPLTPAPARVQRTRAAERATYMFPRAVPLALSDIERPIEVRRKAEARRQRLEKEDVLAKKVGGLWRGRACFSSKGCFGRRGVEGRKKRRWIFGLVTGLIVLGIILAIALSLTIRRKRPTNAPSAQGLQWLNLTGYPPIPTSVATIIKPDVVSAVTACVFPNTMWSCSLPKELQQSGSPNNPDQPNFKLQILYRNDSTPKPSGTSSRKRAGNVAGNAASAGGVIRDWILSVRDVVFQPAPPPPSLEDQRFLGKTTDGVRSSAKEGEETPLYISFLSDTAPSSTISKRQQQNESGEFPDPTAGIPPPSMAADGTAAPANLLPLPLPVQQPVRLYDRGLPTEHYGFYNYFDRSIFLKSTALLNQSDVQRGPVPSDESGGATESEARVRCTWAQTRFLVQIWTNMGSQQLISSSDANALPYPVTITLDRHGGDATQKLVYCYGMDLREKVIPEMKQVALENRAFGGALVGGGQGPLGDKITTEQGGLGGIDGGTGGCRCEWRNFRSQG